MNWNIYWKSKDMGWEVKSKGKRWILPWNSYWFAFISFDFLIHVQFISYSSTSLPFHAPSTSWLILFTPLFLYIYFLSYPLDFPCIYSSFPFYTLFSSSAFPNSCPFISNSMSLVVSQFSLFQFILIQILCRYWSWKICPSLSFCNSNRSFFPSFVHQGFRQGYTKVLPRLPRGPSGVL